jgi:hypothetical protein
MNAAAEQGTLQSALTELLTMRGYARAVEVNEAVCDIPERWLAGPLYVLTYTEAGAPCELYQCDTDGDWHCVESGRGLSERFDSAPGYGSGVYGVKGNGEIEWICSFKG